MPSEIPGPGNRPNQGSVYLITSDGRTLSLPIPSDSLNDPLRWSLLRRSLALASMSMFTVVSLIIVQGTSLFLGQLGNEYSSIPFRIDMLSSIPCLFWGIGAVIWVPLCLAIGRRPVFLLCTLILTGACFVAAVSQSFYVHLTARCMQGLAGAISPSVMILMIIDMTYIHQRPLYIALFWCFTTVLSNIGLALTPLIISAGGSWRAFYWVWLVPSALTIFLALFGCPETYFKRYPISFDGHILAQYENGKTTIYTNWGEVPKGKPLPVEPTVWKAGSVAKNIIFWNRTTTEGWQAVSAFPKQLLICVCNPLILWVLILNALIFGGMVLTCSTYAEVLQEPPYNFSFQNIGLAKVSPAIGAMLAFLSSGILTRQSIHFLAKRNRGVREPEHYVPSFILPVITSSISLGLFAMAVHRQWDWRWILLFVGLDYFSAISVFVSVALWVTEAFPLWAGPAIVVVGAGGYGLSFALSFGIMPRANSEGLAKTYIELGLLTLIVGLVGLPVNYWGARFRNYIYSKWTQE
ncbi:putative MFS-type transporter [Lachnellula suecica]|uniref:Putative MFS-type transporter n=1 Tax=Lachnellula suecica TaxID=602035 RepID=A0A8T9C665_9HELO|nr:putative MFS-type transporter [Lachnellula suecica]